jgi:isopentenyl-diphosphate delta-isomerase
VILKETGCGLDPQTCKRALEAGVSALDTAGSGGTHWGYIEGLRHPERKSFGELFRNWGIPSAQALVQAQQVTQGKIPLLASGGIRSAIDIAKSLYLGACMAGMALPFLKAAEEGEESLHHLYSELCEALRIALFCTNAQSPAKLLNKGRSFYEK